MSIKDFFKGLFKKKQQQAGSQISFVSPKEITHPHTHARVSKDNIPSPRIRERVERVHSIEPTEDFVTSMVVAELTDSAALGMMAGGSLSGALIGEMMNDDDTYSSSNDSYSDSNNDSYSDSYSDSSSDSSSDY